jgi:sugar/nucleoside kinase (ribokinase family)
MAEIVVFGTVAADIVVRVPALPRPGDHIGAEVLGWRLGGSSANLAAALAADGHRVELVSVIGDDDMADQLLGALRERHVSTTHCLRVGGRSPRALVFLDPDGERTIVGLDRGSATEALPVRELPDVPSATCIIVESYRRYPTAVAARWTDALLVATPPPPEATDWPADIVIGSERQFPPTWDANPFAGGRRVAGTRLRWVVVTRAARGADAYGPDGSIHTPARPARQLDATGAGDAFSAGLVTGLLAGRTMTDAMDVAAARGAAAVEVLRSVPPGWLDGDRAT